MAFCTFYPHVFWGIWRRPSTFSPEGSCGGHRAVLLLKAVYSLVNQTKNRGCILSTKSDMFSVGVGHSQG